MEKLPISVIVPVKNEEKNLPKFLPLLKDFDEIIIVDSHSTDSTKMIAEELGYHIIQFEWNGHFPKKRNWTLRNISIRNEWVFFLDADEFITPDFLKGLRNEFEDTKDNVGYWITYNNYFMGRQLKYGDLIRKLALFKRSAGEYERIEADDDDDNWGYSGIELHEQPILSGKTGFIKGRIDHKENRGIEAYIKKHNEFSSWEARRFLNTYKEVYLCSFHQKIKKTLLDTWILGYLYFIYIYFFQLGFLDGKAGFIYASLKKQYFFNIKVKIDELRGCQSII